MKAPRPRPRRHLHGRWDSYPDWDDLCRGRTLTCWNNGTFAAHLDPLHQVSGLIARSPEVSHPPHRSLEVDAHA